jgi:26S proteasome regulatory subunit N13
MQSLFPQQHPGAGGFGRGGAAAEPSPLLSFKAGKMVLAPDREVSGKFLITADKRRGKIELTKGADGLMHFRWIDRSTGRREDDRIVFPQDISFKRCKTGRENDRVYLLKISGSLQPLMFWMQDKSNEKDAENVSKLNEYANNPAAAAEAAAAQAPAAAAAPPSMPGFPGLTPEQWAQMMGLPAPAAAAPAPAESAAPATGAAPAATGGAGGNLDFSSLLGMLGQPAAQAPGLTSEDLQRAMQGMGSPAGQRERPLPLQDIVTSEAVINTGVLNDPAVRASLIEHLPEEMRSDAEIEESLRSPQFRQSLGALSSALQSDNFNSVMANFGIDPSPGMPQMVRGDGVGAFLAAVQADADRTNAASASSGAASASASSGASGANTEEEKKEDDTKMDE